MAQLLIAGFFVWMTVWALVFVWIETEIDHAQPPPDPDKRP